MRILDKLLRRNSQSFARAEALVNAAYFGFLRRLPEPTTHKALALKIDDGMRPSTLLNGLLTSAEFRRSLTSAQMKDYHRITGDAQEVTRDVKLEFVGDGNDHHFRNIIYFCPAISWPVGGIKVIFRQAEIINSEGLGSVSAEILFPDAPEFTLHWFKHAAKVKRDRIINIDHDLVILPEVWALRYGRILRQAGVRYAIFVQNGYFIFDDNHCSDTNSLAELKEIYQECALILTISQDTTNCIQQAFGLSKDRVLLASPSINGAIFRFGDRKKENIIAYMPRKLSDHPSYIVNQLSVQNIQNWQFVAIEGLSEEEVAHVLQSSKIFLSFSEREGFSLPPLEAALCGNCVIGYTGEGAKEYWDKRIFKEIASGDLLRFVETVKEEMKALERVSFYDVDAKNKLEALDALRNKYSREEERRLLLNFTAQISQL